MKKLILVAILLLSACDANPPSLPPYASVQISGKAAMGVVSAGKVTAYDFSQCKKGAALSSITLKDNPLFQLTIVPDKAEHPVVFELSNFTYQEEYSGAVVTVPTERVLSSVAVLKPGDHKNLTISFWTNLAFARTVHQCKKDANNAANHINTSNEVLSKALTFNVSTDIPAPVDKEMTAADNLPAVRYGAANAAIASYTEGFGGTTPHVLYNSSLLAEMAFLDLSFDGVLEGTAQAGGLIFGSAALNTNIYRTEIPNHIEAIISVFAAKSGLDEALFMGVVNTLHNNDSDIFSGPPTTLLGDTSTPELIGKEIVKCTITDTGQLLGGNKVYETQLDVKFDVIDPESSYDVSTDVITVAAKDKILLHPKVYWRSELKPVVAIIHYGTNIIITTRAVTFTNRFGKPLIVNISATTLNSMCPLTIN